MKNKHLMMLLLSTCCFTACVDSNYDLGNINTDDAVLGESWVAPLGVGSIVSNDVVDVDKVKSIQVGLDGGYVAIYSGTLEKTPKNLRADAVMEEVAFHEVNTGDLSDLFEGDFVLALTDPHVKLESNATQGSVDCRLNIKAMRKESAVSTFSDFPLSGTTPNVWIGPVTPPVNSGFNFVRNTDMPKLLQIVPNKMQLSLLANAEQMAGVPAETFSNIKYAVEIPFIPAPAFDATTVERIEDAFDDNFVDYIFSDGSATIYGEVTNEMPFDLSIKMVILNEDHQPLAIDLKPQDVKGKTGTVSFEITKEDMPKMKEARHIDLNLRLTGRDQSEPLKKDQKTTLNLKIKKQGGISI